MIKISLIIPCFNEKGNIKYLFKNLQKLKKYKNLEIILIDNGSSDSTLSEIKFYKYKNKNLNIKIIKIKKNIGFGNGILQGIRKSKGKYICYTHADRETKISDLVKAFNLANKYPKLKIFIKGKRVKRVKNHWTLIDRIFSRLCDLIISTLLLNLLNDIHAQPNFFAKDILKGNKYFPKDFLIDAYLLYLAKKRNFKIIRFEVEFNKKKRKYGEGSSDSLIKKIKGGYDHIVGVLKILFNSSI